MKKRILNLVLGVVLIPLLIIRVEAASTNAYWHTEDETIDITAEGNDGSTIYYEIVDKTTVLHLRNYNGPGLYLFFNTEMKEGQKFEINLEGTNIITSNTIGIDLREYNDKVKVEFTGTGTLQINAPTPISNDSRSEINLTVENQETQSEEVGTTGETGNDKITTDKENKTDDNITTTSKQDNKDTKEKKDNKVLLIISIITAIALAGITIFIIMKQKKKDNIH